ncbi:20148_t:CDS:1, partial [Racocetra fulgida]
MLRLSYLVGYYIFFASIICTLDIQDKMINTVTLLQLLQVYRLRTKERIYEYIINYIDKVKASNIQIPPTCLCQNSDSKDGWCESCGTGMVPGVILPPWTSGHPEINKIIFNSQLESKH